MVPTTMTIGPIFSAAASVVGEFETAMLLVIGIAFGIWGVRFVIGLVKKARR